MLSNNLILKPVAKKEALSIFNDLVEQGLKPSKIKFCNGKYNWTGSASDYRDKECSVSDNVKAVWVERRQDADGPYAVFMCVAVY